MTTARRPIGRPGRFARFEQFEAELSNGMCKRPRYFDGIGLFKGAKANTVFVKIRLPHGGTFKGRSYAKGDAVEIKLGNRSSWTWETLIKRRDELQGLADRNEPLETADVETFTAYATEWLDRKKPTLKSYGVTKGNVSRSLTPHFGSKKLDAITTGDVNKWISKRSGKCKPATVQRELNTFKSILNDAVRSGIIKKNPADGAEKIRGIEPRQRFVTDEEWQKILATVDRIEKEQEEKKKRTPHQIRGWLRHYVVFAYNSGMRRAEILNLTWDRVRKINDTTTQIEVVNTKTSNPRLVTCTDEMKTVLKSLETLERADGDNRLFPLSMTTLKRSLTRLWRSTGLNDVRLHDLRRTHSTILMDRNIDARTVAGRLGHSNTSTLIKYYAAYRGDIEAAKAFETPEKPASKRRGARKKRKA
ncbi:MAG: site-specific integrase [Sphingobium sp.]|nr:site-specific integrase [Sphingobium sp.]MCP5397689.1 site-specific integrase [Sphingomonas sp.]